MKDVQYITHDIGARNDPKLMELQRSMGGLGLGIWWCLVEMLWENDGYLPMNPETLAYALRWATEEDVRSVLCDFGLFENDGERVWNRSALERIQHKRKVSEARAIAGLAGGIASGQMRRSEAIAKQLPSKSEANLEAINKLINKEIKEDISIAAASAAEKKDIYRLFFFKNFKRPEHELQRFLDRYEGNWCRSGCTVPERDHMKLARNWKPEDKEPRFKYQESLDWLKKYAAWAADKGIDPDELLHAVDNMLVGRDDYKITLRVKGIEWRDRLGALSANDPTFDNQQLRSLAAPFNGIKYGYV